MLGLGSGKEEREHGNESCGQEHRGAEGGLDVCGVEHRAKRCKRQDNEHQSGFWFMKNNYDIIINHLKHNNNC